MSEPEPAPKRARVEESPPPSAQGSSSDDKTTATLSTAAQKRLMKELQKMKQEGNGSGADCVEGGPIDESDLSRWSMVMKGFDDKDASPNSKLLADELKKMGLDGITFNIVFPYDYPTEPPFVYLVKPRLMGGRIFAGGGMCMDLLMPAGWSPANQVPAVLRAIRSEIQGECKAYDQYCIGRDGKVLENTEHTARVDFKMVQSCHSNWLQVEPRKSEKK